MKRIEIAGEFFRVRRGILVKIPDKWVGKTVYKQTIRKENPKGKNDVIRKI
jgi:hypothetical protein